MFWIETTNDAKRIILFSQVSLEPFSKELYDLGGSYFTQIQSREKDKREGWVFPNSLKAKIEEFIARETNDVASNASEPMAIGQVQDLLLELFDRVAVLEQKMGITE